MPETKVIGIVLFDGVEELDAVGPWEVLAYWTLNHPDDGYRVITLAPTDGVVTCAKGLRITPDHTFADAPALDVVLHPGGRGTRPLSRNREHLDWVRAQSGRAELMTSVCTGSLVYAAAGLLRGRPATTHWASLDELAALDATIKIDENARFVDDVDVVTSAGVSAGIDLALHLVSRLSFPYRAVGVRRAIQYDPQPPV
ncbi:DJ-1/PfpI family protein [Kineosporia rhizophila]|uniref:DJ-1/PfpI family protein n=1 Tax=Kineosporia rhizophila TaxID=84633 RepID=UPI001E598BCA|nr:DJ-1/PfpI family protein [Kineosporia rhizophila]MCE0540525.1 DJ-1/PfpI family protein [Kineosporia rhizophila]